MLLESIKGQDAHIRKEEIIAYGLFVAFYSIWSSLIIGYRIDHAFFFILITCCFFISKHTRNFLKGFIFFAIFWIIYDGLRAFPNYNYSPVHILQPYQLEKALFGIGVDSLSPNEYFKLNSNSIYDVIAAFFYLSWVPVPLSFAMYLFFTDREMLLKFSSCYLFTNLVGFIGYYSYPAAPPWYIEQVGTHFVQSTPAYAAQLLNFDNLISYPLFENLYKKNSNVFAAIPSLHSAYPVVTWYFARKTGPKWLVWLIFIDILGIWWAAVYSNHHYVIDVIFGLLTASISILLYEKILLKTKFSNFIRTFAAKIN